jgi:hypothetical protein
MRVAAVVLCCCCAVVSAETTPTETIDVASARVLLFGRAGSDACDSAECLLEARYAGDAAAKQLALALYADTGDIAGVGADEVMDGGFRGKIHLVPELPVGKYRQQLEWASAALHDIDAFFAAQFTADAPPAYRWRALGLRFVRSVGKHTPSAYASGWSFTYNVEGSLMTSAASVRETLFHELFHVNDGHHNDWSRKTLGADYDAIVAKCGTDMRCLAPFAPNDTYVRGGTYYAFQPDNGDGAHEYAAELAVRYFKEQREMRANKQLSTRAFKCGPAVNARAWKALVDEFFAGRDLVPGC